MFFLVVVRKGDKFNDNEWISLLNNFLWFLSVEIKQHEDKIRLPTASLADVKNARSETHVLQAFHQGIFQSLSISEEVYGWPVMWHLLPVTSLCLLLWSRWGLKASLSTRLRGELP